MITQIVVMLRLQYIVYSTCWLYLSTSINLPGIRTLVVINQQTSADFMF